MKASSAAAELSLSKCVWGIEWTDHLPFVLEGNIRLEIATLDEVLAFAGEHYSDIFGLRDNDSRFLPDPMTPAKRQFLALADKFCFRDGERIVGLMLGHVTDWSTYYWRSAAFVREYQGRGLAGEAANHIEAILAAKGIVRVEAEVAPTNYRQLRLVLRLGYRVTGSTNSERWGTMLRLTHYLDPKADKTFAAQFCRDDYRSPRGRDHFEHEGGNHEKVRHDEFVVGA